MKADKLWEKSLKILSDEINPNSFHLLFKDLRPIDLKGNELTILIQNSFKRDAIKERFLDYISNALNESFGSQVNLKIIGQLKKDSTSSENNQQNLHKYTFDNFVVGSSNELAFAASKQIAEFSKSDFNPLYIYSDVGLGKTHLLLSIHKHLARSNKNSIYISSERFTNEYINSIKERKTNDFRKKYRDCDALLIDDIQFLSGKTQTQEGFFHTFNDLFLKERKIIIAGDDPLRLVDLESRLVSRFQSGLVVDIQPPDFETKVAIIKHKIQLLQINLSEEIIEYIANLCKVNIRQIESIIYRLKAMSSLTNQDINIENAKSMIIGFDEIKVKNKPEPSLVIPAVSKATGISEDEIKGKGRGVDIVMARRLSCFVLNKDLNLTTTASGSLLNKNHASIINGVKFIEKELKNNFNIRRNLQQIRNTLKIN